MAELKSREKSGLDTRRHKYKVLTVRLLFDRTRTPVLINVLQQGIDMEMCPSEEEDGDAEQDQELLLPRRFGQFHRNVACVWE